MRRPSAQSTPDPWLRGSTSIAITEVGATTIGRANKACALSGTMHSASTCGPHDRTAGAEVVGRRAGRGRTDDAVASPPRQRAAVDLDDDLEHPLACGLLDADLVDREGRVDELAVVEDVDVEREPVLGRVALLDDGLDRGRDVLVLGLGEEADVAEVDAEHRGQPLVGDLGGPQDAAVAAEDDGQLAAAAGIGLGVGQLDRGVVGRRIDTEVGRLGPHQPHHDAVRAELLDERARDVAGVVAPGVGEHEHPAHGCRSRTQRLNRHGISLTFPRQSRQRNPRSVPRCTTALISSAVTVAGPSRSHRKNSTLPDGPGSGLTVTPWAPSRAQPPPRRRRARSRRGARGRARRRPCGIRSLPTSNCGLTISARSPSGRVTAEQRVEHQRQRDERQVADHQVDRAADHLGRERRGRSAGRGRRTRGSCCSDQSSWP